MAVALHRGVRWYKAIIDPKERDDQRERSAQVIQRDHGHVPCGVDDLWRLPVTARTGQGMARVRFIAVGASTRQAASQMFLSPRTIDAYLRGIYAKLGITSRTELRAAADLEQIIQDAA